MKMSDYGPTKTIPTVDVRTGHSIWAAGFRCPVEIIEVQHRKSTNTRIFHYRMESYGRIRRYTIERPATGKTTVMAAVKGTK